MKHAFVMNELPLSFFKIKTMSLTTQVTTGAQVENLRLERIDKQDKLGISDSAVCTTVKLDNSFWVLVVKLPTIPSYNATHTTNTHRAQTH